MSLVYRLKAEGPSLVLTDEVLSVLLQHRQLKGADKEAGGQLFANFQDVDTFLVQATKPKRHDKRTRFGFAPNQWLQKLEILAQHKKGLHFVGDWHTHPESVPTPSRDDLTSMIDCFTKSRHELEAFLMVIVGTAEPPKGLFVALVNRNELFPLIAAE